MPVAHTGGKPAEGAVRATEGHGKGQGLREERGFKTAQLESDLDGWRVPSWRAQELTSLAKSMLISVVSLISSCSVTSVAVILEV